MGFCISKSAVVQGAITGADELSPRTEKLFRPTIQIAWIIDCSQPLKGEDPDDPEWVTSARNVFHELGFEQVIESVNRTSQELYHDFRKMQARLSISRDYGE